ncbi:MAG: hypothetical protein CM1200mP12_22460 [Gammaproteobacteria bacterium]|nr:MAG: hypothetical protein CM1200mP12_22460 [Gammaproteobacteria bacterium]
MDNSSPQSRLIDGTPVATKDLTQAKRDLDKFGFCLIPDVLTGTDLLEARQRLTDQAEAEGKSKGFLFREAVLIKIFIFPGNKVNKDAFTVENGGINQRLWMLANKGQCFRDMVIHPYVDELVGHILGQDFILSTHSANIAKPGGVRMGLHTDQWWMPQPVKPGEDYIRPSQISRKASESFLNPNTDLGISPLLFPIACGCFRLY